MGEFLFKKVWVDIFYGFKGKGYLDIELLLFYWDKGVFNLGKKGKGDITEWKKNGSLILENYYFCF